MVTCDNWAVIRRHDGLEWIDQSTISVSPELAEMKANEMDQFKPEWGNSNPVIRVVRVRITEL